MTAPLMTVECQVTKTIDFSWDASARIYRHTKVKDDGSGVTPTWDTDTR
jgi:hypothetical protein